MENDKENQVVAEAVATMQKIEAQTKIQERVLYMAAFLFVGAFVAGLGYLLVA